MEQYRPDPDHQDYLEVHSLINAACDETGYTDFGDPGFTETLDRYLRAVVTEGRLTSAGVQAERAHVHGLLVNRLRYEHDRGTYPEILNQDVSDPIIIVGLPRTGTTKLQRMISSDPAVQMLVGWQALNPAPLPNSTAGQPDPRLAIAQFYERMMAEQFPEIMAAHPWQAEEADEEWLLLLMTFMSAGNAMRVRVPSFRSWVMDTSQRPVYRYLHGLLQYLQWQIDRRERRPWVLKSPTTHIDNIDILLETFPDATIVHCHRDLTAVMPSIFRLLELVWSTQSDHVDPHEVGSQALAFWAWAIEKNLEHRQSLGDDPRIVDVQYAAICDDPITVISRVYQARGQRLSAQGEKLMTQWALENPQHRFGKHAYSLDRYGVDATMIAELFAAYIDQFGSTWRQEATDCATP